MLKLLEPVQQNTASNFGSFLRNQRKAYQITLRQLSVDTGLDQPYLSRLERGLSRVPKQDRVNQIADSLCRNQGLSPTECNIFKRRVLQQAGYLFKDEDLIEDLSNRFADKLRAMNISEAYVVDALQKVPIEQMRKVLLGKESLEIRDFHDVSDKEIETRRSHGEQVIALGGETGSATSHKSLDNTDMQLRETQTSATDYIKSHAHEFESVSGIPDSNRGKPSLSAKADPNTLAYIEGLHMEISGLQDQLMMMAKIRDEIGELQTHINRLDTVFKDVMGDK